MTGHAGAFSLGKVGECHWRYVVGGVWRSPNFEINDIGFQQRADWSMSYLWIAYREWKPKGIFRNYQINYNLWRGWNFGGEKLFDGGNINANAQFKNYWGFWLGVNRSGEN